MLFPLPQCYFGFYNMNADALEGALDEDAPVEEPLAEEPLDEPVVVEEPAAVVAKPSH